MDAAAHRCKLQRDTGFAWRDEPRAGRTLVNFEDLLRVDEPGIPGSLFDTAIDFRYVRTPG